MKILSDADVRVESVPSRLHADEEHSHLTAVRLTYLPTGQSVTADIYKSGPKNKAVAWDWLAEALEMHP